jgi:hypothetical protein
MMKKALKKSTKIEKTELKKSYRKKWNKEEE